jgi:5-methylthioadenosine/S-adenosylhomocysteine deaminase
VRASGGYAGEERDVSESVAIVGATVVTMDDERTVLDEATVVVEAGRFQSVEPGRQRPAVERIVDGQGRVMLPGLVNCHLHSRPGRALGDGMPLSQWHALYPDGFCRHMTEGDSRAGALLAFADLLKGGTTTVIDMTCKPVGAVRAAEEIGIRAVVVPLTADEQFSEDGACDVYGDVRDVIVREAKPRAGSRVQFWHGFDSLRGVTPATLRAMSQDARDLGIGIHGHMSESRDGAAWIEREHGVRPAAYLHAAGVLGRRTVLAHCNWLTDDEIALLAASGTSVSHNPTSNMKLGTGVCPVGKLLDAGVNVGLGTDGMLSNFHLDMFEVMRGACLLQRIHRLDPHALMSEQVLAMATRNGARAVGLGAEIGSIEVGKRADAILLPFDRVHVRPWLRGAHDNLLALLVWCAKAADVETVLVDGRVVVEGRQLVTVPEGAIVAGAQAAAERLCAAQAH